MDSRHKGGEHPPCRAARSSPGTHPRTTVRSRSNTSMIYKNDNAMHDLDDPDTHTHWRLLPTQHPWTTTQPTKGLLGTRTRCALDMTPAQGRCCVAGHPPPSTHPHTIHNTTRASVVNTRDSRQYNAQHGLHRQCGGALGVLRHFSTGWGLLCLIAGASSLRGRHSRR